MMFTLLCPMLLLDSWTNALPQEPYKISHLQPQPGTIVTLNDVSNEPGTSSADIVSRQVRQVPRDWLYSSSYNPNRRSSSSSSSSSGLAYRSIIPQSSNHYTNYYRNRNLYTGAPGRRRQQEAQDHEQSSDYSRGNNKNDNNLDVNPSTKTNIYTTSLNSDPSSSSAPGLERNYNDIVNSNFNNNPDLTISSSHTSASTTNTNTKTTTTLKVPSSLDISASTNSRDESIVTTPEPRSAPATDPLSTTRLSSTLQMQIDNDDPDLLDNGDVSARDAIGFVGVPSTSLANTNINTQKREPKGPVDPVLLTDEQDSMIIFPGNVSRSSLHHLKRENPSRPGKASLSDDEAYVPPILRTWDVAALQSLRKLLETRKKIGAIETRYSTGGLSKNNKNIVSPSPKVLENDTPVPMESLEINRPPSCAGESGYCEEIDTYPKDFLNQVLKKTVSSDVFQEVFGDSIENNTVATDVVGRNDLQDTPLCNSIEHTIYPKVAKNRDGKFMYVVNHDDYIQGVRVEKCVGENNSCMFQEGNPTGYQSTCRQKFIYKKLLAFTPEGKAMTDTFRLPSCCVCYLRSAFVGDRINALNTNANNNNNNNEPLSSKKDSEGTEILPKNSDLISNDEKHLDNFTSVSPTISSLGTTSTSSVDLLTYPTTISTTGDTDSEIEHFMDGLHNDNDDGVSTHGKNDSMADIITSGPFFRSF